MVLFKPLSTLYFNSTHIEYSSWSHSSSYFVIDLQPPMSLLLHSSLNISLSSCSPVFLFFFSVGHKYLFLFGEWKIIDVDRQSIVEVQSLHLVMEKINNNFSLTDYCALDGCSVCSRGAFPLKVSAGCSMLHAGMPIGHSDCDWTQGEHWSFCLSQWRAAAVAAVVLLLFYFPRPCLSSAGAVSRCIHTGEPWLSASPCRAEQPLL